MPPELAEFVDVHMVPAVDGNREASLTAMRQAMIESRRFSAAVFVGGMEGSMRSINCSSNTIPKLQCSRFQQQAAAKIIYQQGEYDPIFHATEPIPAYFVESFCLWISREILQ